MPTDSVCDGRTDNIIQRRFHVRWNLALDEYRFEAHSSPTLRRMPILYSFLHRMPPEARRLDEARENRIRREYPLVHPPRAMKLDGLVFPQRQQPGDVIEFPVSQHDR